MALEFNYKLAWQELANPSYEALPQVFRDLYQHVAKHYKKVPQDDLHNVIVPSTLIDRLDAYQASTVALAHEVIYAWGHWSTGVPNNTADAGAYWKTQKILSAYLSKRLGTWSAKELITQDGLDARWLDAASHFMTHKPGTDYSLEELPSYFQACVEGVFTIERAAHCNYRVDGLPASDAHPFCIGPKHFTDHGTIDPEKAPCAMKLGGVGHFCHRPLEAHHHDVALYMVMDRDVPKAEAIAALLRCKEKSEVDKTTIDGFAFPNLFTPQEGHQRLPGQFQFLEPDKEEASDDVPQ